MTFRTVRTERWDELWWVSLKPGEKFLYQYFSDRCNEGGFLELIPTIILFQTGLSEAQLKSGITGLKKEAISVSTDEKIIWVKSFLKDQQKYPLNPSLNDHMGLIAMLRDYAPKFGESSGIRDLLPSANVENSLLPVLAKNENNLPSPEIKGNKSRSKVFVKPTIDQVAEYFGMQLLKNEILKNVVKPIDIASSYFDYYEGRGWRLGGKGNNKMVDWQATCRRWIRTREEELANSGFIGRGNGTVKKSKAETIINTTNEAKSNTDWNEVLNKK